MYLSLHQAKNTVQGRSMYLSLQQAKNTVQGRSMYLSLIKPKSLYKVRSKYLSLIKPETLYKVDLEIFPQLCRLFNRLHTTEKLSSGYCDVVYPISC